MTSTLGLRAPDMVNIVNYGNYAIAANFLYQAEGIYRATTLSNPSMYNFYDQLIDGQTQSVCKNPEGSFQLFRVGDAVAARNTHAAIYDALRLVKDL